MRKVWTILLVAGFSVVLAFGPASALDLTNISDEDFVALFDVVVLSVIDSPFSFVPGDAGTVTSATYSGKAATAAVGLFAYTYQIESTSGDLKGITVPLLSPFPIVDFVDFDGGGNDNTFYIGTDDGSDDFGAPLSTVYGVAGEGTIAPSSDGLFGAGTEYTAFFTGPVIPSGGTSFVFGFVSNIPPTTTIADVLNGGDTITSPTVVTPTPEPATALLLGSGFLGLLGWGRRRRRRAA